MSTVLLCDCGWRVQVLNPLFVDYELRVNFSTALAHWRRGHRVGVHKGMFASAEKIAREMAPASPRRTEEDPPTPSQREREFREAMWRFVGGEKNRPPTR